ncbi:MAG: hypothetical protein ACRDO4_08060, partial [Nocardioides sp.]
RTSIRATATTSPPTATTAPVVRRARAPSHPLCRHHHRHKTHSAWDYVVLEPGSYLWTSPHRYQYLRDHTGTLDVTHDRSGRGHRERD